MTELIPSDPDALLPSSSRRQTRRAMAEVERRASVIEAAAERKIEMAARINHKAKLDVVASVGFSKQLKQLVPEAGALLDTLDVQTVHSISRTLDRASR